MTFKSHHIAYTKSVSQDAPGMDKGGQKYKGLPCVQSLVRRNSPVKYASATEHTLLVSLRLPVCVYVHAEPHQGAGVSCFTSS